MMRGTSTGRDDHRQPPKAKPRALEENRADICLTQGIPEFKRFLLVHEGTGEGDHFNA